MVNDEEVKKREVVGEWRLHDRMPNNREISPGPFVLGPRPNFVDAARARLLPSDVKYLERMRKQRSFTSDEQAFAFIQRLLQIFLRGEVTTRRKRAA